ncbi:GNAT family N-acetyltransferase [Planomonospora sp. ID82291]|uniref:GNAT family N-acetyltransferase n=1 Tax=Planomonospora sp. ID82291 TaxID=2738136 RepID=UPI0018C43B95|nr:GNAT family N-acetyltransferase [Planomonospora sp. ID82291]MBG0813550.1 GNAT family N-acetyltransferase [Planomonospora sp. ID82291]
MTQNDTAEARSLRTRRSPRESARFGLAVERLIVSREQGAPFSAVRAAVLGSAADVIVLRYPAEHVDWFAGLAELGRTALAAGSLVYWRLVPGRGRGPEPPEGLELVEGVSPAEATALISEVFVAYGNHYAANPLFDPDKALAGYLEWMETSAAKGNCLGFRERDGGAGGSRFVGVIAVEQEGSRVEPTIGGVVPEARGRGLYGHLLRAAEEWALGRGATELLVSTQDHNMQVQRVWARHGFQPSHAVVTVHLVRSGLLRAPGR